MVQRRRPLLAVALLLALVASFQWFSLQAVLGSAGPGALRDAWLAVATGLAFVVLFAAHEPGLVLQRAWRPVSLLLVPVLLGAAVLHLFRGSADLTNPAEERTLSLAAGLSAGLMGVTLVQGPQAPWHGRARWALATIGVVVWALLAARLDTYLRDPYVYVFSVEGDGHFSYQFARHLWNAGVGLAALGAALLPRPGHPGSVPAAAQREGDTAKA